MTHDDLRDMIISLSLSLSRTQGRLDAVEAVIAAQREAPGGRQGALVVAPLQDYPKCDDASRRALWRIR